MLTYFHINHLTAFVIKSSLQVMTMLGLLFTYSIGAYIHWRLLSIICACVPIICIICLYFLPRSPSFLLSQGAKNQARSSLQYYRGDKVDVSKELLELEKSILESQNVEKTNIKFS